MVIMRVSTVLVQTSCEYKTYSVLRSAGAASASAEVLRRWVQQQEEEEEAGDEVQGANMHQLSTSPPSLQLPCSEPASAEASPACSLTPSSSREAPAVDERRRRKRQRLRRACWRHRRRRTGHFDGTHTFNCFDLEIN